MSKRLFALLLCLALPLSACGQESGETPAPPPTAAETATPTPEADPAPEEVTELWGFPIDDTHDAFEVPTGGKLGTVLVTVERVEGDHEFMDPATLSVWNVNDLSAPIQVMEVGGLTHYYEVLDANFDGYMDLSYTWYLAATNRNESLWLWDESAGKFVYGADFLGRGLVLDEEEKLIYTYRHASAVSGMESIFQWENEELICVRCIVTHSPELEKEPVTQLLTVEDYADGEWVEVYRETFEVSDDGEIYKEALLWYDLNYHGE